MIKKVTVGLLVLCALAARGDIVFRGGGATTTYTQAVVRANGNVGGTTPRTVSVMFMVPNTTDLFFLFCSESNNLPTQAISERWYLSVTGGQLNVGAGGTQVSSLAPVTANIWHHAVLIQSASSAYVFYDGQQVWTGAGTDGISTYLSLGIAQSDTTGKFGSAQGLRISNWAFWRNQWPENATRDMLRLYQSGGDWRQCYYEMSSGTTGAYTNNGASSPDVWIHTGQIQIGGSLSNITWKAADSKESVTALGQVFQGSLSLPERRR